jgi:transposase InsO family protein
VSHHFQAEIRFLGIASSPAFVREPEGNGCAERFIRVLKENLLWIRRFDTIEELRLALQAFRHTYNQTWIIERHGYRTPAQVRADQLDASENLAEGRHSRLNGAMPTGGAHGGSAGFLRPRGSAGAAVGQG